MNKLLNMLLRSSISASITDREVFTDRVAQMIEEKIGDDPEAAQRMSERLAASVDSLNEQSLLNELFAPDTDNRALEEKIERLTVSIDKLNANIEKLIENGIR